MLQEEAIGRLEKVFELEELPDNSATFLKVRLFPSEELLRQFTLEGVECEYTDEFFDDDESTFAKRQVLIRRRGEVTVHQTRCTDDTVGCRIIRKERMSVTPMNTRRFLWYGFTRQRLQPQVAELSCDAYLDTVTTPFEYQVLSIRIPLNDRNPTTIIEASESLLSQLGCRWGDVIPVGFSKFVFVLKCLPTYDGYEECFGHWFDHVDESITKNIDSLLSMTDCTTNQHLYIWTLGEQLNCLSTMREYGKFDDKQCRDKLATLYARVAKGTTKFVRCDPYEI